MQPKVTELQWLMTALRASASTVRFSSVRPRRITSGLPGVLLLAFGCAADAVSWGPAEYVQAAPAVPSAAAEDSRLCAAAETAHGALRFRAGWSVVSGELVVMKSADGGGSWESPVVADMRERGSSTCERPRPALFVDSANTFLHLTYYARPPGAPGVYYVHSMNAERLAQMGEGMFEEPVAITFGSRPVRTTVASRGDTVVIAHEDPNSPRGGVQVALSTTAGHSFERRMSGSRSPGSAPIVELREGEVIVWWRETSEPHRWLRQRGAFD